MQLSSFGRPLIVDEQPTRFSWGTVINLTEFPELLTRFQRNVPTTADIEQLAAQLVRRDFDDQGLQEFIRRVCKWGGYAGIAGRVIQHNRPKQLAAFFRDANQKAHEGKIIDALKTLQNVKHLGQVSFASKHLKFLSPDFAVVADSIISNRLGYAMTPEGYQAFLADCHTILQHIVTARLDYTGWGANGWRVSDVEMAITTKLRPEWQ
jgi:hypothetical protein